MCEVCSGGVCTERVGRPSGSTETPLENKASPDVRGNTLKSWLETYRQATDTVKIPNYILNTKNNVHFIVNSLQAYKAVVNDATIFKLELPLKQKG